MTKKGNGVKDAIHYFIGMGFIEDLNTDAARMVQNLIKGVEGKK